MPEILSEVAMSQEKQAGESKMARGIYADAINETVQGKTTL